MIIQIGGGNFLPLGLITKEKKNNKQYKTIEGGVISENLHSKFLEKLNSKKNKIKNKTKKNYK